jgi:excisionase family DNA binding protein
VSDVMNLGQLAAYLQMSEAQVYHLLASGKVPGVKVGKQWRFARTAIESWLQSAGSRAVDVLIVDDDAAIRDLIQNAMRDAGHRPVSVASVSQALGMLEDIRFDVAIIDLLLPDGSGFDIVKALSGKPSAPEVIMITAHPEHELIGGIRELLPFAVVLEKPFRLQELVKLASRTIATRTPVGERE